MKFGNFKKFTACTLLIGLLISCLQFKVKAVEYDEEDIRVAMLEMEKFTLLITDPGKDVLKVPKKIYLDKCMYIAEKLGKILKQLEERIIKNKNHLLDVLDNFTLLKNKVINSKNMKEAFDWVKEGINLYYEIVRKIYYQKI